MKLNLQKKVLLSMGVVAGIGALAGAGTFATFTAQTTNPSNTFANGTLVLSNKVGAASACLSTGGGNTDTNSNARLRHRLQPGGEGSGRLQHRQPDAPEQGQSARLGAQALLRLLHRRRRRGRELPRHRLGLRRRPVLRPAVLGLRVQPHRRPASTAVPPTPA